MNSQDLGSTTDLNINPDKAHFILFIEHLCFEVGSFLVNSQFNKLNFLTGDKNLCTLCEEMQMCLEMISLCTAFLLARALDRLENPSTSSCLKNVLFGLSEPGLPANFQKGIKT